MELQLKLILLFVVLPFVIGIIAIIVKSKNVETKRIELEKEAALQRKKLDEENERKRIEKRNHLKEKYKDEDMVNKLMDQIIWQGETKEMLIDSLGKPEDIDSKVMKTKSREIYKYFSTGINRYSLKITIEDDKVVGWDKK